MVGRRARRLVAVSPYVADHLRHFGFHAGAIDIIPNGLPPVPVRAEPMPREGGTGPVFAGIFSGGWDGLKNGAVLIEAFAMLRRNLPRARLLLVGTQCEATGPAGSCPEKWCSSASFAELSGWVRPV
jgi:glycosyltransferase involved in cell wall biosynthesis